MPGSGSRFASLSQVRLQQALSLSLSTFHTSSISPFNPFYSFFHFTSLSFFFHFNNNNNNTLQKITFICCMVIGMERKSSAAILLLFMVFLTADLSWASKKEKICDKGWECKGVFCCNDTISDLFKVYNFEDLFAKRNTPVAHAIGFWDYQLFITAAELFESIGFGTTGGKQKQMKEIAAFLGHVGSQTSCRYNVATGGPYAWGLCYDCEMSPSQSYCNPNYLYPCTPGVEYYG